jgi:serine/threonine-protein kinase
VFERVTCENETWEIGPILGCGGFGNVYEAHSGDVQAAAKFISIEPGASRELLFEELSGTPNVVPILDIGTLDPFHVIVMPRAEMSLADHLAESGGKLPESEALAILESVATALSYLQGKVVHRDIKPQNVLLLDGNWCLTDFGIARYAENSTSDETRKSVFSAPYTSPERWEWKTATSASDIYSLGAMAFELLTGRTPFKGPSWEDFRSQHIQDVAPQLPSVGPLLASLIHECLIKAPEARPTAGNFIVRVNQILTTKTSVALSRLQEVNRAVVLKSSEESAAMAREAEKRDRRIILKKAGIELYSQISAQLKSAFEASAPNILVFMSGEFGWFANVDGASIALADPKHTHEDWWRGQTQPGFDLCLNAAIKVTIPKNRYEYSGRGHSLWFCDAVVKDEFRWYELAFMDHPLMIRSTTELVPEAFDAVGAAAEALGPAMGAYQLARPFTEVSQENMDDFVERWIGWFADAATGKLNRPDLPESNPTGSWRR